MRRREKFVLTALILSLLLFVTQMVDLSFRYWSILAFAVLTYFLSGWALMEDLQKHEFFTILPLPALYALSVSLFNLFIPENWLSRVLLFIFFAMGMYAILLSSNIFSVAKARTIQLLYAAQAISLFFTLLISFLFISIIFVLKLPFWLIVPLVGLTHFPLVFSSIWSVNLKSKIERGELLISFLPTLVVMQFALVLSFLPLDDWLVALLIMALLYLYLSFTHSYLKGRLFDKVVKEYLFVAASIWVLFIVFFPGK